MNEITDDVMERLAPTILSYMDKLGIPHDQMSGVGVGLLTDGVNNEIQVSLTDMTGIHLLMRLHPATHGLLVIDGQLVIDDFEV